MNRCMMTNLLKEIFANVLCGISGKIRRHFHTIGILKQDCWKVNAEPVIRDQYVQEDADPIIILITEIYISLFDASEIAEAYRVLCLFTAMLDMPAIMASEISGKADLYRDREDIEKHIAGTEKNGYKIFSK